MRKLDLHKYLAVAVTACLVLAFGIAFYFCFDRIIGLQTFFRTVIQILMPVIWGVGIAYLLSPIYNYLHRNLYPLFLQKMSRRASLRLSGGVSIFLALMLLVIIIWALLAMIVPQLVSSISSIVNSVPTYVREVRLWLYHVLDNYPDARTSAMNLYNSYTSKLMSWVNSQLDIDAASTSLDSLLPTLGDILSGVTLGVWRVVSFLKNIVIGFIVSIYLLANKKRMCGQAKKLIFTVFHRKTANGIIRQCRFAHKTMSGFISGKLLDSLIIGVICFIATTVLQIPYSMLVSVIIGMTNIIPFFGPFIGAVPCALFILLISPVKCLTFVILILVLQQFDGNILGPKILGDSTGLSSFWVIFSLLLFGGLFGVIGMILGVPVFAVVYHLVEEASNAILERRKLSTKTADYELLDRLENDTYHKVNDPAFKQPEKERRRTSGRRNTSSGAEESKQQKTEQTQDSAHKQDSNSHQ